MMMAVRHARRSLIAITLLIPLSAPAFGQWIWKDQQGNMVASDQPPPTSVPKSRIIKEPHPRPGGDPAPSPDKDTAKADTPKSLADRDLDQKQKQKEAAEAAKKAEDEAAKAKAMQENCTSVKGNLAALQAGGRAARFNDKGERVYIDDAERATEIQKSQGQIAQYCK
jgi:hypothetical protein